MGLTPHIVLLLAVGFAAANDSELVPVYMWQTIPTKGVFPAVTHVSQATFREILLQKHAHQHSDKMIIFAEENLSPEDFSAQTFYELSQLSDHTRVTYLPTVSNPMEAILASPDIVSASVEDIIRDPKLLERRQLIIDLNDARDDEDRVDMLKRHSKFIAEVYEKISASRENVLAIYTGRHSSWIVPSDIVKHRQTRAAGDAPQPKKYSTANFLVYVDGVFVYTDGDGKTTEFTVDNVDQSDKKLTFHLTGGKSVDLNYVVDGFENWIAKSFSMNGVEYQSSMYNPLGFSYSCSSNMTARQQPPNPIPTDYKPTFLQFPTFQLQYFADAAAEKTAFYDSYDCVGFTSAPIWSGLFVTLILAIIMSIGLAMIMDIKTMDRFDDPKGKTIVVNATD